MLAQRPVGSLLDAAVTTASKDTSSVTARAMQPSMLTQQQFLQMQQMQQMQQLQQQQPVYYMNASAVGGEAARPSVVAPAQATSPAATAAAMAAAAASIMASRVAAANAASVATLSPDRRSPKAQQLPQQQQQLLPNLVGGAGRPVASSGLTNIEDLLATSGFAGLGQGRGGSSGGSNNAKGSLPARKRQRSNGVEVARSPAKERKLLEYPSGEATNELHKLQLQAQQQQRHHQEQLDALAAASATSLHAARSTTILQQAKTQPAMQRQTSSSMSKQQREESTSPPGSPMPGSGLSDLPIDKVSYPFWAPAIRDHLLGGKPLGEKEREQLCAKVVEKLQADLHAAGSSIADLAQRTDPQNGPMHVKREGAKYFPRKNRTSRFVYHSFKDSFEASFAAATYRCCFGRGGSIGLPNFCDLYMPRRGPCLVNHVYETKSHISSMSQQLDQLLAQGMSVKEESSKQ